MLEVSNTTQALVDLLNSLDRAALEYSRLSEKRPSLAKQYENTYTRCVSLRDAIRQDLLDMIETRLQNTRTIESI